MKLLTLLCLIICLILFNTTQALPQVVNVYAWAGEIPEFVVRQFEKETGLRVNFASYENNEIMFTKVRTSKKSAYDVVMPSSYFVDRMKRLNLLEKIDKTKLPNWKNLDPTLLHPAYDPELEYSVPYIWGITGIFYNDQFHKNPIKKWQDLWQKKFDNQLMLLDDTREVFSMALISLGYSPNDNDPAHIKAAFLKLKKLMQNVKVFSTETVISIMIDEDATLGMAWNGDTYRASVENPHIKFIFPEEGFVIWVDNFSIPKNATHKEAAYTFINFMLRPDIAKKIALYTQFPIANLAGQKLLPDSTKQNQTIYPAKEMLKRGHFLIDVGETALTLYEKYWEELKMGG